MLTVEEIMKRLLAILIVIVAFSSAYGQQSIQYDPDVLKYYKEGIRLYDAENYKEANRSFRKALATNQVLPTNLSYYFAETLYHLGQYQNSKNFIEKYIGLAGYGGDFYNEATALNELLDSRFTEITECYRCNKFGYRLQACDQCEASGYEIAECHQCKGLGNSICPKCTGRGVNIKVDSFGQKLYEECDLCNGAGHTPCELCKGEKIVTRTCLVCFGTKVKSTSIICDHTDHQLDVTIPNN